MKSDLKKGINLNEDYIDCESRPSEFDKTT